ncbi:hypothetical protein GBAR_LOCUS13895 [Geodia barretti]|nr:hypothetical protein GBAR_LOCUS13895 [Geodia barretti]
MEEDDLEAADSGVGPSLRPSSSGRLSSLSHYSDGTVIQIPGERLMEEREDLTVSPTDPFKLLAGELGGHMASGQKVKTKPSGGKSTKKRKATSDMTTTAQKQKPSKTKGKKRKRGKKPTQKDSTDGGGVSHGSSKVNVLRDLESKRREKRELERQREEQARERARLEDELRKLRESKTEGESEVSDEGASEGGGRRGRGECVAMARGGIKADMEHKRNDEDTCHRKRDSTEGHRRKLTEAERAARAREAYEKGAKLREKSNYNNHRELQSLRLSQSITPAYTFSYFQHVPPRGAENSSSGGTAKGSRRGQQSKKQRQPKK